jgi:Cu(I)/Ag(I) efflux system periplasmic protein CusF
MWTMSLVFVMALAFAPALGYACNDHAPGTEAKQRAVAQRSALVAGEVREIDLDEGTITLAHGRIASLRMQPMSSMLFKAGNLKLIANLKPGDKFKFRATIVGEQPTITDIKLPEPSAARSVRVRQAV